MEALATVAAILVGLVGLVGLDLAALRWGSDSRQSGRDRDRRWSIR